MGPSTPFTLSNSLQRVLTAATVLVVLGLLNPGVIGDPSPVMSFPDSGVYSLFPHEDLRTGKSIRPIPEQQFQQQRTSFASRRGGGRVLFDDDRLNFRGHFDSRERDRRPGLSEEGRIPYPPLDPRFPPPQAYGQSRLPPRIISDDPPRIHVFNPTASPQGPPPLPPPDESLEELRPGRLFIPSRQNHHHNFIDIRDPGPDNFHNHDEFLDYHTRTALGSGGHESQRDREPCKKDARRLLFSSGATIRGLVPPSTESSTESSGGGGGGSSTESSSSGGSSVQSFELPEVQSLEQQGGGKIHVTALVEETPRRVESVKRPMLLESGGFIPIAIPPQRPTTFFPGEEELPRTTQTINNRQDQQGRTTTETPTIGTTMASSSSSSGTTTTTKRRPQYPLVPKSPHVSPGHVTRVVERPWGTLRPSSSAPNDFNLDDSETITFSPNTFDDFVGRTTSSEFAATKIRTEVPLIFLDSQQDPPGRGEKNAIFIKRLKNPKNSGKGNKTQVKSKSGIESSMTVHSGELGSGEVEETQGARPPPPPVTSDEVKATRSMSVHGIVAKVHAHVSHCPKLLTGAEIICDVHIRKRHGSQNPQLIVGWKRKFHNATKEDVLLAVNTTLAYIEEDFHDKFNVTLTPGISPMLRSVLTISRVNPNDTGNYECQVDDGENKLRSDTLLFLCH